MRSDPGSVTDALHGNIGMTASSFCTRTLLALWLSAVSCTTSVSMARTPPPASLFESAAECVAVLKQDLRSRLHAHPSAQENDTWIQQAESAFAHAGGAYQAGVSEEQAQQMLDRAEEHVARWPDHKIAQQASRCQREGLRLLERASALERLIVRKAARRWLGRQLRKLAP